VLRGIHNLPGVKSEQDVINFFFPPKPNYPGKQPSTLRLLTFTIFNIIDYFDDYPGFPVVLAYLLVRGSRLIPLLECLSELAEMFLVVFTSNYMKKTRLNSGDGERKVRQLGIKTKVNDKGREDEQ
jgi:hypothetical protein